MLPAQFRMRTADDFARAVRSGGRVGRKSVVVHLAVLGEGVPRIGFVVGRAVGKAVVRNRVRRRLRALVREYVTSLPAGSLLVVRALPQAATASQAELAADLDLVIQTLVRRQVGELRR